MNPSAERTARLPLLLAVALILLLCFWGIGDIPFVSINEARRAVTVREMLASGNWLLPTMNGVPYLAKPPLFNWLQLLPAQWLGMTTELTARLPSACFALLSCLIVYVLGQRLGGRPVGLYAALILAANTGFSMFARRAEIEMTLSGLSLLSLLAAWQFIFDGGGRRWLLLSFALTGLCLLTKGPVGLLFVVAPLLAFASREPGRARRYLGDVPGWLLALAIGGSWYLAVSVSAGWDIWAGVVQEDIVAKVGGTQGGEAWYAYLLYLAGDFAPFWLILFVRPRQLWQQIRTRAELRLLACCVLVPLLSFSLFADKHGKYLLPAYPAIALLLAWHWSEVRRLATGWRHRLMTGFPLVLLAAFVGFYALLEQRVFAHRLQALPAIAERVSAAPDKALYSIGLPDMRLVYYAGRPVVPVEPADVSKHLGEAALLFIREPLPQALAGLADCPASTRIAPYLKRHKSLLIVPLDACQAAWSH